MVRPTRLGGPIPLLSGVLGHDPDISTGDPTPTPDIADDGTWEIPASSAGVLELVNQDDATAVTNTFSWDFTPTIGDLLVIAVGIRNGGSSSAPTGWTLLVDNAPASGTGFDDGVALYAKVSAGNETSAVFAYGGSDSRYFVISEWAGIGLTGNATNETTSSGTSVTTGSVTPTAGSQALVIGAAVANGDSAASYTPGAGWTELYEEASNAHPHFTVIYQIVSPASGSYNPATTLSGSRNWRGVTAAFMEPAELVWTAAPLAFDGSDTTFEFVLDTYVTAASLVFIRGELPVDAVLAQAILRVGLENAGSVTIEMEGATEADFSDQVSLGSVTFTATGSYAAQDVTISLPGTTGYRYVRFLLGSAQGIRVYDIELRATASGVTDHGALSGLSDNDHPQYALDTDFDAHLADTTDAHDASAISFAPAGTIAATNVQAAIEEVAAEATGGGVTLSDDTPLVESGSGSAGVATTASRSDHEHPADGGGGGGAAIDASVRIYAAQNFR